jgi:hypothetical protein
MMAVVGVIGVLGGAVGMFGAGFGCAGGYSAKEKLELSLLQFNAGVRWGRHQQAGAFLTSELRKGYLDKVEELDSEVHVSAAELLRVDYNKKKKVALVRYRFRWHLPTEMLMKKAVIVEAWKWKSDKWVLLKLVHASGDPFPYFEKIAKKKDSEEEKKPESKSKDNKSNASKTKKSQ